MRVGLAFTGFAPIASTFDAVSAADQNGLDSVWVAEHIGFHDAIVPGALYLERTERLEVGLVGLSGASRHPGMLAMELASLAELYPGRVRAAIGTGDPSLVAQLGSKVEHPVHQTMALLQSLREALAGKEMAVEHGGHRFAQFKLNPLAPAPPLDVMAVRPRMVRAAALHADGLSISVGASRRYLRETVTAVEEALAERGLAREQFRISAMTMAIVADDLDAARSQVKPIFSMAEPAMAEHLGRGVFDEGALVDAAKTGGPFAVAKLITPDVIDGLALVATPGGLRDALAEFEATGIDELALALFAPPEAQANLVKEIAAARS